MPSTVKKAPIIGGGIGGLAAAVALRQQGIEAVVCERAPELKEVGAGITLWTNAVRALRKLGLGDALAAVSTPLDRSEIRSWNGKLLAQTGLGALGKTLAAPSVGIHRADLHALLQRALPADAVRLGKSCTSFGQEADGGTAHFEDGSQETGDVLIGADGLNSTIRRQLRGFEPFRYAGHTAWRGIAHFEHAAMPLGLTSLSLGRGSQFGLLPIGGGRTYWFGTWQTPAGGRDGPGGRRADMLPVFHDWHAPIPELIHATLEGAILRNDIFDREPIAGWGVGRVTLLGDAAHPTTPHLGQGACQGLEDAVVLAHCLASGSAPAAALRDYEDRRRERTAAIINLSRKMGRFFELKNPAACWLRDLVLQATPAGSFEKRLRQVIDYEVP